MRRAAALLALTVALGGCGGDDTASPEEVVRSWSEALNADDNDGAADLFASGAEVVQAGMSYRLSRHDEAVRWNAGLPCNGQILELEVDEDEVTAVFVLSDSKTTPCDAPGAKATAIFTVRDGKIVRWEQLSSEAPAPGDVV
ncbi:MAG TPA: nuclear transport factor 2 family protein [Gaiellaceae bacterium]|nr:nuclear transport factor 2 family protein [Gaiellaceae bacterium]